MFGVGFSELLLIGIVALIVIGPERLPKVARTAGLLLGRVQRYVATVKTDIAHEMQLEELHRASAALKESMLTTRQEIGSAISDLHQSIQLPDTVETPETPQLPVAENTTAHGAAADSAAEEESRQIELPLDTPARPAASPASHPTVPQPPVESLGHTDKADPAA